MSNATKFLDAYERIRKHLISKLQLNKGESFKILIDRSRDDAVVKRYTNDLREYADLRNAIIHESTDDHIIAEPCTEVVNQITKIADLITAPTPVLPTLLRTVVGYAPEVSIGEVVKEMQRHSYSQVPVIRQNAVVTGLLTTDTIVRWLAAEVKEDVLSLSETPLSKVLKCADKDPKNAPRHILLSRNEPLLNVVATFEEEMHSGRRLDAVLITQNGKAGEALLGIATVWDIPKILKLTKSK